MLKQLKRTVGRNERIDFPFLGLFDVDAKVDTGAFTSALHCSEVEYFEKDGRPYIRFTLKHKSYKGAHKKRFESPLSNKKVIKNSFGDTEERYIIETYIRIFNKEFKTELSLADRSRMEYPVLLGRSFLKKGFVVDVTKINCSLESTR